jgi:hypothetical protein
MGYIPPSPGRMPVLFPDINRPVKKGSLCVLCGKPARWMAEVDGELLPSCVECFRAIEGAHR